MKNPWTLEGRKALVTGATQGIGRAIAEEFLSQGAEVLCVARTEADVEAFMELCASRGLPLHGCAADVSRPEDCDRIVEKTRSLWGRLDILVNNAGLNIRRKLTEYSDEEIHTILNTNLGAALRLCRLTHPLLAQGQDPSVVNVSSTAGATSVGTGIPYAVTKAALNQLTKTLACEWAPDSIRVNAVAPWYIRTPLADTVLRDEAYSKAVLNRTPMRRVGETEEVARVSAFLAMPAASYVTGEVVAVDGGFLSYGFRGKG